MKQLSYIAKAIYYRTSQVMPGWLSGNLDWYVFPNLKNSLLGPFNGQRARVEIFREILQCIQFQAIIETGTFRGTTTLFLQETSGLPVYTVEAVPRYYHFAKHRFPHVDLVYSRLGDSREFLRDLAKSAVVPHDRIFCYLDAHWHEDLPLSEELSIIADHWADPVIMIDDFEVPDDPDYGFDDYGAAKRLSIDYLPEAIVSHFRLFWPVVRGREENGLRRGCVVIGRKQAAADKLANLSTLREIAASSAYHSSS